MAGPSATEIANRFEAEMAGGSLLAGDRLPSVRKHAVTLSVSPTTVAAAYRRLRERGLVVGRGRQGTRVAARPSADANRAPQVPDNLVDAMSGTPDPAALPDLGLALRTLDPAPGAGYGSALVHPDLAAVARRMLADENAGPTHFTVTSGAMHAIELIIATEQFRIGDRLAVEDPGHIPVHQLGRRVGMELVPVGIDDQGMRPESLLATLRSGLTAVIVTPRVQNPTGAALTKQRATELTAVLADYPDVFLIQDDHAGPISGVESARITPPGRRWASMRSVGKSHGPDLRLAIIAGDPTTIDRIEVAVSTGAGWVSHILQRTAAHLLADEATTLLVAEAAEQYTQRRSRLINALAAGGVDAVGRSGLNVWIPVSDEQAAIEAARAVGFAIRGGDSYRISSPAAVRVTIAALTDQQIDNLASTLIDHLTGGSTGPQM